LTRCRCVGLVHTCGIQNVNVQGPNVVVVGQGGPKGAQGIQGAQGVQGVQGIQGAGIQGAQGVAGKSVSILGTYSSYAALLAAHPTGNSGDAYLVNGELYVWDGSSWQNVGSIAGAQGIQGSQGPAGIQGSTGTQGSTGIQGANGTQGSQGIQGAIGTQGATGSQGIQGAGGIQGATGIQGPAGAQGTTGSQGIQGAGGIQGATGVQGPAGPQGTTGAQGIQGANGGGVTEQQLADAIAGVSISSTDAVPEGVTNLYFTPSRVSYEYTKYPASTTWVIDHNLGFKPNVTVEDSDGIIYEGEISYTTSASLTLTFAYPISGTAYLS